MTVTLLIADDHPHVRDGLKLLLASEDIDVIEATTCQQAVRMAGSLELDAVLLDINMPDGSGLDALARIKQHRPDLPVLMHSEYDRPSFASRSHTLGAEAYLVKGLDKDELLKAIRLALRRDSFSTGEQLKVIEDVRGS